MYARTFPRERRRSHESRGRLSHARSKRATDLAVLGDLRELLDPATDVRDVKAVALARHDALDVHDVLRRPRHALVDDEILGRAESHGAALTEVVVDSAGDCRFLEAG